MTLFLLPVCSGMFSYNKNISFVFSQSRVSVRIHSDGAGRQSGQEVASKQASTQLLQAPLTEVSYTEEVFLAHREDLADLRDVPALEAVIGTNREIKLRKGRIVNLLWDR